VNRYAITNNMTLHLLCATLNNPTRVLAQIEKHKKYSKNSTLWYAVQDTETEKIIIKTGHKNYIKIKANSTAEAWQELSNHVEEGTHMLLGDDVEFYLQDWDKKIFPTEEAQMINCINFKPNGTQLDISEKKLPAPHYAVTQKWRELLGWFVPPGYAHYCIDSYVIRLAIVTNTLLNSSAQIIHNRIEKNNNEIQNNDIKKFKNSFDTFYNDCLKIANYKKNIDIVTARLEIISKQQDWTDPKNFRKLT
jgi:hypothetical protein